VTAPEQASSPNPLPPEATGAPPSKQSLLWKVLSAMFTGGLLVAIVFILIPEFAEYADVGAALQAVSYAAIALIVAGAFLVMSLNAMAMATPIQQLRFKRAFVAQQACTAISNVIPGPSGTAARFAILRSWGVSVEDFTRATFAVSIWSNVTMISMPGVAFLVLALTQGVEFDGKNLLVLAGVTIVVSIIAIGLVVAVLRSERFARWLGRLTEHIYNWCLKLLRKPPIDNLEAQSVELRLRTIEVLQDRGGRLTAVTVGNYWFNGLLLTVCLWIAGVPRSELPLLVSLALYSIGRLSTVIQVTPGGVGVVEVAYTAVYVALLGDEFSSQIVTGVILYRGLTYLMPIIVGGGCYVLWRWMLRRDRQAVPAPA
jgi:uncharacterized protein (TIRG00374 family)